MFQNYDSILWQVLSILFLDTPSFKSLLWLLMALALTKNFFHVVYKDESPHNLASSLPLEIFFRQWFSHPSVSGFSQRLWLLLGLCFLFFFSKLIPAHLLILSQGSLLRENMVFITTSKASPSPFTVWILQASSSFTTFTASLGNYTQKIAGWRSLTVITLPSPKAVT